MPRSLSRSDPIHITSLSGQGRQAIFCNYVRVEDMDQDGSLPQKPKDELSPV